MSTLLHLGGQMIALEHIVRVEFEDAYPGGEEKYDEDSGQTIITMPRKPKIMLTLTSQHIQTDVDDFEHDGYHKAAASENDLVVLRGVIAVELWTYLENQAVIVNLEAAQLERLVKVPAKD